MSSWVGWEGGPGVDLGNSRNIISLSWPGNDLVSLQKSWKPNVAPESMWPTS